MSHRCTAILARFCFYDCIELTAIGSHYILDVVDIFQSSFYLERSSSSISKFLEMIKLTKILERQQITLMLNLLTIGIKQIKLHTTELCTFSTIGRAPETLLRSITYTRIAYAERSMYKDLYFSIRNRLMYCLDFIERKLTSQNDTFET